MLRQISDNRSEGFCFSIGPCNDAVIHCTEDLTGDIVMMEIIAGAVNVNVYCIQPTLPSSSMNLRPEIRGCRYPTLVNGMQPDVEQFELL
ncbi:MULTISPECIES: hypothetical protein [Paraburkholderia]|uniref:hypothetical protein n=1 Tax=Paraburkholderia TaxID=1822464 RepID=UPI0009F578F8|nr:hypothetical protein [Paraburkholderia terricola]ORC44379.1 hypothetical protein B2G74_33390 [Burkholderia sp. A27]